MLIMMTLKDWSFQKCVVHNKFDIYNFTYFNLISHFTLSYSLCFPHRIKNSYYFRFKVRLFWPDVVLVMEDMHSYLLLHNEERPECIPILCSCRLTVTWTVSLMGQERLNHPEHPSPPFHIPVFSGVRVSQSIVFCVMFCISF
jgi:hypothetical protein